MIIHFKRAAIVDDLCYLLADGNIVELGDLGFFSASLKCLQDTGDDQNVHLRISSEFRKKIKQEMKFERVHSLTRRQKISHSTVEERKDKLISFLKINICIT